MSITLLDGVFIIVLLISAFLAMVRGFVREVLSIGAWVVAAFAAMYLFDDFLPIVRQYLPHPLMSQIATAVSIFLIVLIVVSFITIQISDFVLDSRIGALDRTLGFVFGVARGAILMAVAMIFFNWFVPEDHQPSWIMQAKSKPLLNNIGQKLVALLPESPEEEILNKLKKHNSEDSSEDTSYGSGQSHGMDQLIDETADKTGV